MTYEEALAVATANNEIDENQTFLIDKNIRTVTIPDGFVLGVFNDKNVQIVPFAMPRYYNGIDMSTFAIQVNYVNSAGDGDIYLVFDQDVQEDLILFNWVVDRTAFATSGKTGFVVCMKEDDEYGYVAREFNTTLAYAPVLDGLEIDNPIDEQEVLDVLTQIRRAAERADIAAQQAEDSAAQASTDANTASDAASSATSSAATATAAQTSASASATTATNAETNALAYRNAAAASAAEAAAVVSGIDDVLSFPNALVVESATSEDIVTIEDGADDIPMTSVLVGMNLIQDLNGYDKPWPGGGGKNLLNNTTENQTATGITWTVNSDGTVTANGTATAETQFRIDVSATDLPRETNLYFSGCPSGGSATKYNVYVWDLDTNARAKKWNNITAVDNDTGASANNELYLVSGHSYRVICRVMSGQTVSNLVFSPMIRLATESDGTFAPYSNICPISGWDSVNVSVTGKNLLNPLTGYDGIGYNKASGTDATLTENSTGMTIDDNELSIVISENWSGRVIKTAPLKAGDYRVNFETTNSIQKSSLYIIGTDGNTRGNSYNLSGIGTLTMTKTLYDGESIAIWFGSSVAQTIKVLNPQVKIGTNATSYEPYQGQTYQTTLPQTVYGGTLDVVSGVLTVTHAYWTKNTATMDNNDNFPGWKNSGIKQIVGISNKPISRLFGNVGTVIGVNTEGDYDIAFMPKGSYNEMTQTQWKALGIDVEFALPLATPQTYQLTPTEVRTILGGNNIWADSGDVSVEYRADLKMYIDKKIAEAIA